MEKYITDERTGLKYELVGDYYFIAGDAEPEQCPIGIWGCGCPVDTSAKGRSTDRAGRRDQRHLRYLKQHRRTVYTELLMGGKLNDYLVDLNEQAEDMFSRLVKELAEKESITESFKAENQMLWVRQMSSVREIAMEIVNNELIYT